MDQATAGKGKRKNADADNAAAADPNTVEEPKRGRPARATAVKKDNSNAASDDGEPVAKRGRGRPIKRPVGRPRKEVQDGGDSTAPATAAKAAGRGKRGAVKKDDDDVGDTNGTSSKDEKPAADEPKQGGRGKGKADKEDTTDATADKPADNAPAPRKGRGRPKKAAAADEDDDVAADKPADNAPAPRKGRGRPKKAAAAADEDDDDDEDDEKPAKNGPANSAPAARKGRGRPKKAAAVDEDDDDEEEDEKPAKNGSTSAGSSGKSMKTITIKGRAPVDGTCPIRDTAHVFCEGDHPYDAMLNQTNVQNNNNKYYVIQLLEDDVGKNYSVWQRWGRVGYEGQTKLDNFGIDFPSAQRAFHKKFSDKTGNQWVNRSNFVKYGGKYDLVKIDYSAKDEEKDEEKATEPKTKVPPPPSKLHQSIQDLLSMICDVRAMENAVKEMKYDASKAPLGKLTKEQISGGYAALKDIEACIQKKDNGPALTQACNEFYTRIPHYFGMKTPPLIRTMEEVKQKIELLEALSDIEVALRTLAEGDKEPENLHPIDKRYDAMKCDMKPLDRDSDTFELLKKYLLTTHGSTHSMYKLELLDVFECEKDGEDMRFQDVGNKMLLWHGSRLTNWFGILSQGLRIAPPEAPVTGYMFGKGVYFADMSSKSANYCFTTRQNDIGLLVLCEVSLGKTRDLTQADYNADKLPKGYRSTKGLGRTIPDEAEYVTLDNGVIVPCGKPKDVNTAACLQYNEYIVYDTSQIKMKYLLKVKFNYNF